MRPNVFHALPTLTLSVLLLLSTGTQASEQTVEGWVVVDKTVLLNDDDVVIARLKFGAEVEVLQEFHSNGVTRVALAGWLMAHERSIRTVDEDRVSVNGRERIYSQARASSSLLAYTEGGVRYKVSRRRVDDRIDYSYFQVRLEGNLKAAHVTTEHSSFLAAAKAKRDREFLPYSGTYTDSAGTEFEFTMIAYDEGTPEAGLFTPSEFLRMEDFVRIRSGQAKVDVTFQDIKGIDCTPCSEPPCEYAVLRMRDEGVLRGWFEGGGSGSNRLVLRGGSEEREVKLSWRTSRFSIEFKDPPSSTAAPEALTEGTKAGQAYIAESEDVELTDGWNPIATLRFGTPVTVLEQRPSRTQVEVTAWLCPVFRNKVHIRDDGRIKVESTSWLKSEQGDRLGSGEDDVIVEYTGNKREESNEFCFEVVLEGYLKSARIVHGLEALAKAKQENRFERFAALSGVFTTAWGGKRKFTRIAYNETRPESGEYYPGKFLRLTDFVRVRSGDEVVGLAFKDIERIDCIPCSEPRCDYAALKMRDGRLISGRFMGRGGGSLDLLLKVDEEEVEIDLHRKTAEVAVEFDDPAASSPQTDDTEYAPEDPEADDGHLKSLYLRHILKYVMILAVVTSIIALVIIALVRSHKRKRAGG